MHNFAENIEIMRGKFQGKNISMKKYKEKFRC